MIDPEYEEELSSPTACAWTTIVMAVSLQVESISKDTHFAMLHDIAKIVYRNQHSVLLEEMGNLDDQCAIVQDTLPQANSLESLLRMCGSQLHSIHAVKTKELQRLNLKRSSTSQIQKQISFVDHLCMDEDEKQMMKSHLPSADRGKMKFPINRLHSFLNHFDVSMLKVLNYKKFESHGYNLFQVCISNTLLILSVCCKYSVATNCNGGSTCSKL